MRLRDLFKRKKVESSLKYQDGFYVDKNTQGEQSKTAWTEHIRDSKGNLIPIVPQDRIEIH